MRDCFEICCVFLVSVFSLFIVYFILFNVRDWRYVCVLNKADFVFSMIFFFS